MIKGINQNLSAESAERGIGKVFSQRFGSKNILKIQLFRPTQNIDLIIKKRKMMKKKYNKAKKHNHHYADKKMLETGSMFRKHKVDAESHYLEKIK